MFQRYMKPCLDTIRSQSNIQLRCMSGLSKAEWKQRRNQLFDQEKQLQKATVGRIEKIKIICDSPANVVHLVMNKNVSTPYDCARHISEGVMKTSVLALYNGHEWDMHAPLPDSGKIEFLNLIKPSIKSVNKTYWRSCSFLLGAALDTAFKEDVLVHLHSFPAAIISKGCFFHNVKIDLPNWEPTQNDLRALSALCVKLTRKNLQFERLQVTQNVALDMFQDNPYKMQHIPQVAKQNDNVVTLYRLGDHIDISKGPMVGNTYVFGRFSVTAAKRITSEKESIFTFQGLSLPRGILLNSFAYGILERFASQQRKVWLPEVNNKDDDENVQFTAVN